MSEAQDIAAIIESARTIADEYELVEPRIVHELRAVARALEVADLKLMRARGDAEEAQAVCAQAYQVVGVLLDDLGQFNSVRATKMLDNLAEFRVVHDDVLPWESARELAKRETGAMDTFDNCAKSPTGKHSADWYTNHDCAFCAEGKQ